MYQNARIVQKLLAKRTAGWALAEHLDAGFDGGEWSGPAWGEQWEVAQDKAISDVAKRVGMSFEELEHEFLSLENEYPHHLPFDAAMLCAESER